jgi:pilus assembly protein CpaB
MMVVRLLVFVLAAGSAGGAAWLSMQSEPAPAAHVSLAAAERIEAREILVAGSDIKSGEILSPDNLRWEPWPEANLNETFITRDKRPAAMTELSGTFVNTPFVTGEPIRDARLMATNVNLLSNKLAPGRRAVAVKVTAESTAGGFILPGDRVDVIRTSTAAGADGQNPSSTSQIIIANARVLAIDQTAVQTPEGIVVGKTATLELAPDEAELVVAAEASGMLSLALRAVADHAQGETVELVQTRTVRIHRATQTSTVTLR